MSAVERDVQCNEYRSPRKLGSWPLVHLTRGGIGPDGRRLPGRARGIIAVGEHATGIIAIGQVARGFIAIGGAVSVGVVAIGGCPLGIIAVGVLGMGLIAIGIVPGLLSGRYGWCFFEPQSWEIGGWLPLLGTWALMYFVFAHVVYGRKHTPGHNNALNPTGTSPAS